MTRVLIVGCALLAGCGPACVEYITVTEIQFTPARVEWWPCCGAAPGRGSIMMPKPARTDTVEVRQCVRTEERQ